MKKKNPSLKSVIVTVTDEALPRIQTLADLLSEEGMVVDAVGPITGTIAGKCAGEMMAQLQQLPGVLAVEEEARAGLS